jgi:hypothetical protein
MVWPRFAVTAASALTKARLTGSIVPPTRFSVWRSVGPGFDEQETALAKTNMPRTSPEREETFSEERAANLMVVLLF